MSRPTTVSGSIKTPASNRVRGLTSPGSPELFPRLWGDVLMQSPKGLAFQTAANEPVDQL